MMRNKTRLISRREAKHVEHPVASCIRFLLCRDGNEAHIGNVFFFCDSKGNLRHSISGKILVLGIKNDLPCSLTDEQVKRFARIFHSSVLYLPMRDEREQSYISVSKKEVKPHERTGR